MVSALVLVTALAQAPAGSSVEELVGQLAAGRFAEREEASASLVRLGADALPVLQVAVESADLELRTRARSVVKKIEAEVLEQTSMLWIDVESKPLSEVFEDISEKGRNRLAWHPQMPEGLRSGCVTLHQGGPRPFWETIDELCEAGGLRYIPATPDGTFKIREPQFRLFLAPGRRDSYHADNGPLRLELTTLEQWRSVNLVPNLPVPVVRTRGVPAPAYGARSDWVMVQYRLLVEPRMLIQGCGQAKVVLAEDDRGESLLRDDRPNSQSSSIGQAIPARAEVNSIFHLKSPKHPVKSLSRLRVRMPVVVVSRRTDPLVAPLQGTEGKIFRKRGTSIEVVGIGHHNSPLFPVVKVILRDEAYDPGAHPGGAVGAGSERAFRPETSANVLVIFDQLGRPFARYGGLNASEEDGGLRLEVELDGHGNNVVPEPNRFGVARPIGKTAPEPVELHYYEYMRTTIQATFDFRDIPFP